MSEATKELLSQMIVPIFSIITLLITTSTSRKTTLFKKITVERFEVYKEFCKKGSELIVDPTLLKNDDFLTELNRLYVNVLIFCNDKIAVEIKKFMSYLNDYNRKYNQMYIANKWGDPHTIIYDSMEEGGIKDGDNFDELKFKIQKNIWTKQEEFDKELIAEKDMIIKKLTTITDFMRNHKRWHV